jgi:DNA-binding response OmpR family regulator
MCPTLAVLTPGGLVTLSAQWAISDFLVDTAPPAEVEARLVRAITAHRAQPDRPALGPNLDLDENTLSARIGDATVALTWTEFSLLRVLASQPGRVFPRSHLNARARYQLTRGRPARVGAVARQLKCVFGRSCSTPSTKVSTFSL